MLILSEHSVQSAWVREEVESCLERETREKRNLLFPVRLDSTIMDAPEAWAASIRRQRHIGDFTAWKNHDAYVKGFERLLRISVLETNVHPPRFASLTCISPAIP